MRAKTKLLIIAGPQSSGKTTVFTLLKKKYRHAKFVAEINQFTLVGKKHLGSAFVNKKTELTISKEDIRVTEKISRDIPAAVMETGIFHVVYLEKFAGEKTASAFFPKYLKAHEGLDPLMVFIDTKPSVSWLRRKKYYLKRIKRANVNDPKMKRQMLAKYKKNIYDLYPLWIKYFHKIPFKKIMIKNSKKDYGQFIKEVFLTVSEHF